MPGRRAGQGGEWWGRSSRRRCQVQALERVCKLLARRKERARAADAPADLGQLVERRLQERGEAYGVFQQAPFQFDVLRRGKLLLGPGERTIRCLAVVERLFHL